MIRAAQDSFGSGLRLSLLVAAAILLAATGVSLLTEHRPGHRAAPAPTRSWLRHGVPV